MPFKRWLCWIVCLFFAGCQVRSNLAPVSELSAWSFSRAKNTHTVRRGETLYAIAFHYDSDYRQLAKLNHLRAPYSLGIGQVLSLRGLHTKQRPVPKSNPAVYSRAPASKIIYTSSNRPSWSGWYWPVHGRVMTSFLPAQGKKGIDIASKQGEKVFAASSGVVAYAGNGLSGYGNLIIIKHNNEYLTAYGNNSRNFVKEGQRVKAAQVIAQTGIVDHKYWGLHFEIRKSGKPVNPLNYLRRA